MSQLKDIRVLELASVLAGPGVGQFFAELGADVIKVENLKTSGDVTRSWKFAGEKTDERSAYFCSVNWGKQSLAIDLTTTAGREIVQKLAFLSDIIVASYKPGDAQKLGVDYETLSKDHPELIYGQITGYGSDNPRVGYDAVIQAEAGFMFMNGEPGGHSLKMPVALIDVLAAHHLKEGLLLAMLEKGKTRKGKLVEVSLIHAAVSSLANQASNYLIANKIAEKQGSSHPNIAPYGDVFITADGREIILAVGTDNQFAHLVKLLKISDLSKDFRFKTNASRVENRAVLNEILTMEIAKHTSGNLLDSLRKNSIPAGQIRNIREVMEQPEVADILLSHGLLKGINTFVARSGPSERPHLLPPPRLGEHTSEILQKVLNLGPSAIQELFEKGIIL